MHKITIVGLGYVGLPLARLFATKYPVVGFDINLNRIMELRAGNDSTLEVSKNLLESVLVQKPDSMIEYKTSNREGSYDLQDQNQKYNGHGLYVTSSIDDIRDSNIYIITVPTPIDKNNRPVLVPLIKASETVGSILKQGDIVIYESTVYPGATEEDCVPVLENVSNLCFNKDFFVGYSPERINPGDKEHTVEKILKVTSGSTPEVGKIVDDLYNSVIEAGTHLAPTIKVAEAAKVIENSQRDINIAFVNELAKIFRLMNIDTYSVLEAASTKWNFLPFKPGLVGGHCIGVDPYYLAQKAQEYGYHPEIILAGRRLNDSMGQYIGEQVIKEMIKQSIQIKDAEILILGVTFKENCPDVRNTKIVDVIKTMEDFGAKVSVYDPLADPYEVEQEYNVQITRVVPQQKFDAIVLGVAHKEFLELDVNYFSKTNSVIYDVKGFLDLEAETIRL